MTLWQIVVIVVLLALWAWALVAALIDMFDRTDLSGSSRIVWIVFILVLPVLGVFIYAIARPRSTADEREAKFAAAASIVEDGELIAGQLADLARLHTEGVITDEEFNDSKRRII